MPESILLESPVFDPESALKAAQFGVDRLELCSAFSEGGLTPSLGTLSWLTSKIDIPVFVMIRPRGGNFVYSQKEMDVMKEEIRIFSSLGAAGFVFGILNEDGTVHKKACEDLVATASGKPCTFHRAFDVSSDLIHSLDVIVDCGFKRILTSGGKSNVSKGLSTLQELLKKAKDDIIIMPGGGMTPELVKPLQETGYLREVHASCKKIEKLSYPSKNKEVQFSANVPEPDEQLSVNKEKVLDFKKVLHLS